MPPIIDGLLCLFTKSVTGGVSPFRKLPHFDKKNKLHLFKFLGSNSLWLKSYTDAIIPTTPKERIWLQRVRSRRKFISTTRTPLGAIGRRWQFENHLGIESDPSVNHPKHSILNQINFIWLLKQTINTFAIRNKQRSLLNHISTTIFQHLYFLGNGVTFHEMVP